MKLLGGDRIEARNLLPFRVKARNLWSLGMEVRNLWSRERLLLLDHSQPRGQRPPGRRMSQLRTFDHQRRGRPLLVDPLLFYPPRLHHARALEGVAKSQSPLKAVAFKSRYRVLTRLL